jgi:antitoxin StbD
MKQLLQPRDDQQQLDQLRVAGVRECITASCNDPRPDIAAETLFAELDALINDIEAAPGGF